jgi:hypothetical protein
MISIAAREKSRKKAELLRDPSFSADFYEYFRRNWQAQEVLDNLQSSGAEVELLRESGSRASWSYHRIGRSDGRRHEQLTAHPDYVPDEKTAERIAEAVLVAQFGRNG